MKPLTWTVVAVLVVVALGGIAFRVLESGDDSDGGSGVAATPEPGPPLEISVVTALPAEPWLADIADQYNSEEHLVENRPVQVEVIPMDGLSALNKWARGEFDPVPTAWLAESRAWVDQANVGVLDRTGRDVFLAGGQYRTQPVVLSPIVWGIWQETYGALQQHFASTDISWDEFHEAAVVSQWTDLGGKSEWGTFKLVMAHPKRDPAGLTAMVGAAGEFYDKPTVTTDELQDKAFLKWLADSLNTVVDFSPVGVENMLLFGRSNGDAGQIVESYLLANMEGLQQRWDEPLVIVYPDPIAWFDFPYAIYMGEETSALDKKAALDFKEFVLSTDPQLAALDFGLRPANPDVSSTGGLVKRWEDLGVKVAIPSSSRMREASRSGLDALTQWYIATYEQ
jgi:Ca-activated chloride channel family protein